MKVERAQAKSGSKGGLLGAVMGLTLVAGVFLSLVAPTQLDTSLIEVGQPETAALALATPGGPSPSEVIAERSSLDLQLD
ncbi:MAG: hypothetical protein ACHQM4_10345 [Thermoanaerobaculia bacterium]